MSTARQVDRLTETAIIPAVPARRSLLHRAGAPSTAAPADSAQACPAPFTDWRDRAPTEELLPIAPALPRVSTSAKPTGSRKRGRPPRARRHLRAALAAIALAAAVLIPVQIYAAQGISSARQAALAEQADRAEQATERSAPAEQTGQADAHPQTGWLIEGTTTATPSPLDLPRCTTSPDTPLPCLATISPDSRRAVVLEEDASLTALVRH